MSIVINSYTLLDTFTWEVIEPQFMVDDYTDNTTNWKFDTLKTSVILEIRGTVEGTDENDAWDTVKTIHDNVMTDNFISIVIDSKTYHGKCVEFFPSGEGYFPEIYRLKMKFVLKNEKNDEW